MRHFVHGPDGQKYGPADFAMLQQWRDEGRLTPDTMLEPEVGGTPFSAKDVPGLFAPPAQIPFEQPGSNFANYPYQAPNNPVLTKFVVAASILGVVSLCACWPCLGPAAIYCAYKARSMGSPNGTILLVFTIVCMVIGAVLGISAAIQMIQNGFKFP